MRKRKMYYHTLPILQFKFRYYSLIMVWLLHGYTTPGIAQPKIEIAGGTTFTLGVVPEDTIVHKIITVRNTGDDTLLVQHVRTSCGCTVAKPASDRVPPHDSMEIPVSFNTKNFDGPVKKEVYFETNDSSSLKMDIVLNAIIKAIIETRPHYITFNETNLNSKVIRFDTLRNNTNVPIRIDSIITHDSQVTASVENKILEPQHSTLLKAILTPVKLGNVVQRLEIKTDYPQKPSVEITYVGYVRK
ncbi:MAG: DUF1573 domain-containing protein [Bacteroidota bacterium]